LNVPPVERLPRSTCQNNEDRIQLTFNNAADARRLFSRLRRCANPVSIIRLKLNGFFECIYPSERALMSQYSTPSIGHPATDNF
jgi:hypothetical protein